MPCLVSPRHSHLPPPVGWPVMAEMLVAEGMLSERTIARRKKRVLDKFQPHATADIKRAFRSEGARVLDIVRAFRLPYVPRETAVSGIVQEAAAPRINNPDLARLLDFILNGQSASPYEAAFDTLYREVMPGAMDAATAEAMAAAGVGITGPLGRFPGAEKWIRDNAIRFGKKYAAGVTEATNAAIRNQLALGWKDFEPMDKLMARVRKVYSTATDYRAEVIARTEGNRAYTSASHEAYSQLDADGHFWIISGSEYAVWPEICAVNASRGVIPMAQEFEDIDGAGIDGPPAHPNCLCDEGIDFGDSWQLPEWVMTDGLGVKEGWVTINGAHVLIGDEDSTSGGGKSGGGKSTGKADGGKTGGGSGGSGVVSKEETLAAVNSYAGADYKSINTSLRGGSDSESAKVAKLDAAFDSHGETLDTDVTVYRGSSEDLFADAREASAGDRDVSSGTIDGVEMTDRGFVSSSLDHNVAAKFTPDEGAIYEITVPKGTRVIPVHKLTGSSNYLDKFVRKNEREVLLKRGSRFRVKSYKLVEFKLRGSTVSRWQYKLEVIQ